MHRSQRYPPSLSTTHVQDVSIGLVLVGILEVCVANEDGVHVGASVLVELVVASDHDHCNLHITEDAQLIGLLQETSFTLAERDLHSKMDAQTITFPFSSPPC